MWYSKAGEMGHAVSLREIAVSYARGRGVPQDEAQAVVWFRKAAGSDSYSANWLADWYSEGRGVPKDDQEAMLWRQPARAKKGLEPLKTGIQTFNALFDRLGFGLH